MPGHWGSPTIECPSLCLVILWVIVFVSPVLSPLRRARYLLDGAKHVVEKLGGSFPETAKELLQVPGAFGTAGERRSGGGERVAMS